MTDAASTDALPRHLPSSGTIESWLERQRNWLACALAITALQIALVITHRPWLDEWQALQISLQSPTLSALFENLRYEGHPPTWYLLLRGAGDILPANWVLPAVQLPIALAIVALILFALPLPRLERLLYACNPFVLVDYGAISRSLGLGVLLFMAATLFRQRHKGWLALALLPMIDFLFGVLSIALVIVHWRQKKLWAPGLALWLVSAAAAVWFVRPAPDMIPAFWLNGPIHDGLVELSRFGALLMPMAMADGQIIWNETPPIGAAIVGGVLFIGMGLWVLRRGAFKQMIFGGFAALIFSFSIFVYPLAIRHVSLAAMLLVLLVAMQRDMFPDERRLFATWLALSAACGISLAVATLVRPFDAAPSAAKFIIDHHLQSKHWASFPDSRGQGVSALTGVEFERLERNCVQSFIRWNYRSKIKLPSDLDRQLDRIAQRGGTFYLLTDFDLLRVTGRKNAYRQMFFAPPGVDGQEFFLYQVRPDLPEKPEHLQQCPPKRLPLSIEVAALSS